MGSTQEKIREGIRERYASIATSNASGCGCSSVKGCCGEIGDKLKTYTQALGYSSEELANIPAEANMGLGCGNPGLIAALKVGECVLDLGSGGGFDCFLAARAVGPEGRVIGVDMTPEMVALGRKNIEKSGFANVEFRLGEIEHLPVADNSVDVVISNCVVNLSRNKAGVYAECARVLREGGRLAISDIVALKPLLDNVRQDLSLISGCVGGAEIVTDYGIYLKQAGFSQVTIEVNAKSREFIAEWFPGRNLEDYVASAMIQAVK